MATENFVPPQRDNILHLLLMFTELEQKRRTNNIGGQRNSPQSLAIREKFLSNLIRSTRKSVDPDRVLTKEEKQTRRYVRHVLRKTRALMRPTRAKRLLYGRLFNRVFNWALGRNKTFNHFDGIMSRFEDQLSTQRNVASLQKQLKQLGFKDYLEEPLSEMIAAKMTSFPLPYYDIHRPDTDYVLHFNKMPGTDSYYLEKFEASHRLTDQEVMNGKNPLPPITVNLSNDTVLNADEARTVAAHQPLQKEDGKDKVFIVPDGGIIPGLRKVYFDVERALDEHNILEMQSNPTRSSLISDISKGQEREVTMNLPDGRTEPLKVRMEFDDSTKKYALQFRSQDGMAVDTTDLEKNRSEAHKVYQKVMTARSRKNRPTIQKPSITR